MSGSFVGMETVGDDFHTLIGTGKFLSTVLNNFGNVNIVTVH